MRPRLACTTFKLNDRARRRASEEEPELTQNTKAVTTASPVDTGASAFGELDSSLLLSSILSSLDDNKAEDVVCIPLAGKSEIADHMVIASGRSSRQVSSIAQNLSDHLKQAFGPGVRVEGGATGDWVLIDAGDVIVHVFRPEVRDFYQLEKMWGSPETGPSGGAV